MEMIFLFLQISKMLLYIFCQSLFLLRMITLIWIKRTCNRCYSCNFHCIEFLYVGDWTIPSCARRSTCNWNVLPYCSCSDISHDIWMNLYYLHEATFYWWWMHFLWTMGCYILFVLASHQFQKTWCIAYVHIANTVWKSKDKHGFILADRLFQ